MASRRAWCEGALMALVVGVGACKQRPAEVVPPGARVVPARIIPVPTTVSPELQRVIAEPVRHNDEVKSADEWRRLQRNSDEWLHGKACVLSKEHGVTVTPTTIGGVKAYLVQPSEVAPENRNRLLV